MWRKGKKRLAMLLTLALTAVMFPLTASAAGTTVKIGNQTLSEGANTVGEGTATLDTGNRTLTLENVSASGSVAIDTDNDFTVLVKGQVSIGSEEARTNTSALYSWGAGTLNIQVEEGAVLSLYTAGGNNIYTDGEQLSLSGPGTITANVTGDFPALYSAGGITGTGGITLQVISEQNGIYTQNGNIEIENANVDIQAGEICIFAQTYVDDEDVPSKVTLRNSSANLTVASAGFDPYGIFCGTGGILIENTTLNSNIAGGGLYSEGDITISGADTKVEMTDQTGSYAGKVFKIQGGDVQVSSDEVALVGYYGVEITGGTVTAEAKTESAVIANRGSLSITGEHTKVTAVTHAADKATLRNVRDGGIYLASSVTISNTAGGALTEGIMKDKSTGITLGEGYDAFGLEVYTNEDGKTYFIAAGGENNTPATGTVTICKHTWGTPIWTWTEDYSGASAKFVCTQDVEHFLEETATVTVNTTDATCGKDGKTIYTAKVTFQGNEYTDEKSIEIPATGKHQYKEGKCQVCGEKDPSYKPADTDKAEKSEKKESSVTPKTGDSMNLMPILAVVVLSGVCVAGTAVYAARRKRR